mmetsp:Transcript_91517/g.144605  ORF Transcript_91517/g.144605 Transcript_91517/m.144605 type:complete len:185 (+) Transcript_91517:64-618(+)
MSLAEAASTAPIIEGVLRASSRILSEDNSNVALDVALYSGGVISFSCLVSAAVFGVCYSFFKGDKQDDAVCNDHSVKLVDREDDVALEQQNMPEQRVIGSSTQAEVCALTDAANSRKVFVSEGLAPTEVDLDAEYEKRLRAQLQNKQESEKGKCQLDLCSLSQPVPKEHDMAQRKSKRLSVTVT